MILMRIIAKQLRPAMICLLVMIFICGILYTGIVTGIAALFFPHQANGSIISADIKGGTAKNYGSELIAQEFTDPKYLIGRPAGVTNLSPVSDEQKKLVEARVAFWRDLDPSNTAEIPADLVMASGSGVDPNISPEAAEYQVKRIARERNISEDAVRDIINRRTSGRLLGFIGEPSVNVLLVNLELDGLISAK